MSYEIGTANGYVDLLDKLKIFVTSEIKMGSEKWAVQIYNQNYDGQGNAELILKGPGTAGDDEIFVGLRTYHNATEGFYNWCCNGYTGYDADLTFFTQPGSIHSDITLCPQLLLSNSTMKYWFVANGRRICGCVRISTIYVPFYFGFVLPYGTPNTLPYPLVIGGSTYHQTNLAYLKWSSTNVSHRGYMDPYSDAGTVNARSSLKLFHGSWISFGNVSGSLIDQVYMNNNVWPGIYANSTFAGDSPNLLMWYCESNIDGSYSMFPLILVASLTNKNIFGEFQGVFAVFGDGIVSEDVITYDGKTYLVFQNCYHIGAHNYWALLLE
jgi:hypothetical protein